MGAFFLYQTRQAIDLSHVSDVMSQKGFSKPSEYCLGNWKLYLYPKLSINKVQMVQSDNDFAFAVGTMFYRGFDFEKSLQRLLKDIKTGLLDDSQLYGHYTVILYIRGKLQILCDILNVKHVFTNTSNTIFSSSLLAIAAGMSYMVSRNTKAFYEKCLTGLILSPDTMYNEILVLNDVLKRDCNKKKNDLEFLFHSAHDREVHFDCSGRTASVKSQVEHITEYLYLLKNTAGDNRIDLGLSGGYDSTLLFAACKPIFGDKIHVHTHSTGHVHDHEKKSAQQICAVSGIACDVVPTQRFDEMEVDPTEMLIENVLFFDGRTSFDIGGFSPTYRAAYRLQATDRCPVTLTGVGGELYRNSFSQHGNKIEADKFFESAVFNAHFKSTFGNAIYMETKQRHIEKAEKLLNVPLRGKVPRLSLRRYYSEIMMPEGQGHVLDAYNTVSYCIAPFLECSLIWNGYKGIPYLGNAGEYEETMICQLDLKVAEVVSSYGFPFAKKPFDMRCKEFIRTYLPNSTWRCLAELKLSRNTQEKNAYLKRVIGKSQLLKESLDAFMSMYPNTEFSDLECDGQMAANLAYYALVSSVIDRGYTNEQ